MAKLHEKSDFICEEGPKTHIWWQGSIEPFSDSDSVEALNCITWSWSCFPPSLSSTDYN